MNQKNAKTGVVRNRWLPFMGVLALLVTAVLPKGVIAAETVNIPAIEQALSRLDGSPALDVGPLSMAGDEMCLAPVSGETCPEGYSFVPAYGECLPDPVCKGEGVFNPESGKCETEPTDLFCQDSEYQLDPETKVCQKDPTCIEGDFDVTQNLCVSNVIPQCEEGLVFNESLDACTEPPPCDGEGETYNPATKKCEKIGCADASFTYNAGTGLCEKVPTCDTGFFDPVLDMCVGDYGPNCPDGFSYNGTVERCEMAPVCVSGTYNPATDMCEETTQSSYAATVNETFSGSFSVETGIDSSNDTVSVSFSGSGNKIYVNGNAITLNNGVFSGSFSVHTGYNSSNENVYVGFYGSGNKIYVGGKAITLNNGVFSGSFSIYTSRDSSNDPVYLNISGSGNKIYINGKAITYNRSYSCPAGGTLSGTTCIVDTLVQTASDCSTGSLDGTNDVCYADIIPTCADGYVYDEGQNRCEKPITCDSGTYNPATEMCEETVQSSYAATGTLVGGTYYGKAVYRVNSGFDDNIITSSSYWPIYGYAATSSFSGAKSIYIVDTRNDPLSGSSTGNQFFGYVSNTSFSGAKPVYGSSYLFGSGSPVFGYVASSKGTYGGTMEYSCPQGGTLSGTDCIVDELVQTTPCGIDTVDSTDGVCFTSILSACPAGMSYDETTEKCTAAVCSDSELNSSDDLCFTSSGTVQTTPVCPGGVFNETYELCLVDITPTCTEATILSAEQNQCTMGPTCENGTFQDETGLCSQTTLGNCLAGFTFDQITQSCQKLPPACPEPSPDLLVPISGQFDIYASLPAEAQVPLVVNGIRVEPGQSGILVASNYNFDASGGKIRLPLASGATGQTGSSQLALTTTAPASSEISAGVNVWAPTLMVNSSVGNDIQQAVQPVTLTLNRDGDTICSLSSSEDQAKAADAIANPVCFVEWDIENAYGLRKGTDSPPTLSGRLIVQEGEVSIGYHISLFGSDGSKVPLSTGSHTLNAVKPELGFSLDGFGPEIIQKLETIKATVKQNTGLTTCRLTTVPSRAIASSDSSDPLFLLKWDSLPGNLVSEEVLGNPYIKGTIDTVGTYEAAWSIEAYGKDEVAIPLFSGTQQAEVVPPPLPELSLISDLPPITDGGLAAYVDGGELGYVKVTVPRKAADITLELSGVKGGDLSARYYGWNYFGSSDNTTFSRLVNLDGDDLWKRSTVGISAYYTQLPDVRTDTTVEIMRVPPKRIYLALNSDGEALDTTGVPISLKVGELSGIDLVYSQSRLGDWTVQPGTSDISQTFTPFGETVELTDGVYNGVIPGLETGTNILQAKGTLTSPDGSYAREIMSNRRYVVIFRGASPDAEVITQRLTGPAPFQAVFGLQMDKESRAVLGEIDWQYSDDAGETWKALPVGNVSWRANMTFDVGKYLVRAKVVNSKSGEVGYTDTIEIQAYNLPDLEIEGPATTLVGGTTVLMANTTLNGTPVDAVVEWRNEKGELLVTGPEFTKDFEIPEMLRLTVSARMPDAPAEDQAAWVKKRHYLTAKTPAPPRGQIRMPYYMEAGTSYELEVAVSPPYWGMDETLFPVDGQWTLPDGSTATGKVLQYTPTVENAETGIVTFKYTAWIEGYRELGAEATIERRVRVGQYIWPEFEIRQSQQITQAPSDVYLQVVPVDFSGNLEKPEYTWTLPSSAEILQDYGVRILARFKEPGTFDVSAQVIDTRGSEATVTTQVVTEPATPFEISTYKVPSNKYYHAPLTMTVWPKVTGGHPRDRMTSFKYALDGEPLECPTNIGSVPAMEAGTHILLTEGVSQMGETAALEETIEVVPNNPPTCIIGTDSSLAEREVNPLYVLQATCTDSDGYIASYRWYMGEQQISTASKVGIPVPEEEPTEVQLEVRDNTGGANHYTVTLNPSE